MGHHTGATMRLLACIVTVAVLIQSVHSRTVRRSYYKQGCPEYQIEVDGECYDVNVDKLEAVRRTLCAFFNDLGEEATSLCGTAVTGKAKRFFGHTGFGK